jgi:hypothetical protein
VGAAEEPRRDADLDPPGRGPDGPAGIARVRPDLEGERPRDRLDASARRAARRPALGRDYWRTAANTESKFLFLRHCFETLGCVRVALKTDGRNLRSQEALTRLGAVREGTLRKHMNVRGYQRDTVYFSILDTEWPAIRTRLSARLYA